jgi:hypothetical protein
MSDRIPPPDWFLRPQSWPYWMPSWLAGTLPPPYGSSGGLPNPVRTDAYGGATPSQSSGAWDAAGPSWLPSAMTPSTSTGILGNLGRSIEDSAAGSRISNTISASGRLAAEAPSWQDLLGNFGSAFNNFIGIPSANAKEFRDPSRIGRPGLLEGGSGFGFGGGSTAGGRSIFGGSGARGYTAPAEPLSAVRKKKTVPPVLPPSSPEIAPAQGDVPEGADSERETPAGSGRSRNMSHCLPLYERCQNLHGNKVLRNGKRCENCFDMCTFYGEWPFDFCPLPGF